MKEHVRLGRSQTNAVFLKQIRVLQQGIGVLIYYNDDDDDDDDLSSYSYSESEEKIEHHPLNKTTTLFAQIYDQIRLLYTFGALLRQPFVRGRYLNPTNGSSLQSAFLLSDQLHVEEKLRQWNKESSPGSPHEENQECEPPRSSNAEGMATSPTKTSNREPSLEDENDTQVLVKRLAAVNSGRREQMIYWETHPFEDSAKATSSISYSQAGAEAVRHISELNDSKPEVAKCETCIRTFQIKNRHVQSPPRAT
ncbi:hypothetical protein M0657_005040 [Pyricularia oryzae]|nr:hypothetical protein M9X92_009381 [Pyricularia oryzae]KAI7923575.1 hypothetical protein M0657_005040 [Pyricularia oryzae]